MYLFFLFFILTAHELTSQENFGIFDFRLDEPKIHFLDGKWEIYPFLFILPEKNDLGQEIKVPSGWHDARADLFSNNDGFATYRAKIYFNDREIGKLYALRLNQIATAYRLFLNKKLVLEVGQVAQSPEKSKPKYQRLVFPFVLEKPELEIIIQASNYEEGNVGGIWQRIAVGPYDKINFAYLKDIISESIVTGFLFAIALYHVVLYSFSRKFPIYLSFGLFSFVIALRSAITGEKILVKIFPFSFKFEILLEYLTLFLGPAFFSWYLHNVYPKDMRKSYFYAVLAVSLIFTLFSLFLPMRLYTLFLPVFQLFLVLGISFFTLLLSIIMKRKRYGSRSFALSFLILVVSAFLDVIFNRTGYGVYYFPVGLSIFVLFQAYFTSRNMSLGKL